MPDPITVIGLSTTDTREGVQYTLLTKTSQKYYDYIFTPNVAGKHTLRINPTVDKIAELQPLQQCQIAWHGDTLMLITSQVTPLYNTKTKILAPMEPLFQPETEFRPKRIAMIINGSPEAVLPFISNNHSKVYSDTWEHLPSVIPEDVIILNSHNIPIQEIVLRLPQRTQALVITPKLLE